MNENERELLEGLRALAAVEPREAPAHIEKRLVHEFRRRSRLRRRIAWAVAGAAAIAASVAVLWLMPAAPPKAAPRVVQQSNPPRAAEIAQANPPAPQKVRRMPRRRAAADDMAGSFYALPGSDELPPVENATVVRVQLPRSSFRLVGLPVSEDRAGDRIQADMLLGQDGLVRAVRFVQ